MLAIGRHDPVLTSAEDAAERVRGFATVARSIAPAGVRVQVVAPEEPLRGTFEPSLLDQVLLNLTTNACQAMPDGGELLLEVAGAERVPNDPSPEAPPVPGRYVRITARDSGVGIHSEDLPRIFEPFFTTRPDGTGLGLAAVFAGVRQQGGHITVHSEPGKGSAFHVFLPAAP
jgi:two-component system cell cycle sensor histidine kinase/response regulator CckA